MKKSDSLADDKIQAPIKLDMHVMITDGEGVHGTVTIGLGALQYVTPEDIRSRIQEFLDDELPDIGAEFRLMNANECMTALAEEKYGQLGVGLAVSATDAKNWEW